MVFLTSKSGIIKRIDQIDNKMEIFLEMTKADCILHSANDERVDASQARMLSTELEKAGKVHKLIIYPMVTIA